MANWRNTVLGTMILRRGIQNKKSLWLSPKAFSVLSGRQDSNLRPPGPKPGALPACATSRKTFTAVRAGFEPAVQSYPYGSLANY